MRIRQSVIVKFWRSLILVGAVLTMGISMTASASASLMSSHRQDSPAVPVISGQYSDPRTADTTNHPLITQNTTVRSIYRQNLQNVSPPNIKAPPRPPQRPSTVVKPQSSVPNDFPKLRRDYADTPPTRNPN